MVFLNTCIINIVLWYKLCLLTTILFYGSIEFKYNVDDLVFKKVNYDDLSHISLVGWLI